MFRSRTAPRPPTRRAAGDTVYAALVEAGAPELEEPYFYRIRENEWVGGVLDIELRYGAPRGGSSELRGRREVAPAGDGRRPVIERLALAAQELGVAEMNRQYAEKMIGDRP